MGIALFEILPYPRSYSLPLHYMQSESEETWLHNFWFHFCYMIPLSLLMQVQRLSPV